MSGNVRASVWASVVENYLGMVLSFLTSIVVARLLTPAEVGVYSIGAVFMLIASVFRDFGVGEYLIQSKDVTVDRVRACITINLAVSWLMAASIWLGSEPAARYFAEPGVGEVMRVSAMTFVLVPFGAVTMAFLRREMAYRQLLVSSIASNVVASAVTVACALRGYSHLSMAIGGVSGVAVSVIASFVYRPGWFPTLPGWRGVGEAWRFGVHVSGVYLFARLGSAAPSFILGRAVGPEAVGLFSRAQGLFELFGRGVLAAVERVGLPYFAQVRRNSGSTNEALARVIQFTVTLGWPFCVLVILLGKWMIVTLFGPNWVGASVVLSILAVTLAIEMVFYMTTEFMIAHARPSASNALQLASQVCRVACMAAGSLHGLEGVAYGCLVGSAINAGLSMVFLARVTGFRPVDLWGAIRKDLVVLAGVALAGVAVHRTAGAAGVHEWATVPMVFAAVAVAWLVGVFVLRHPVVDEIRRLTAFVATR